MSKDNFDIENITAIRGATTSDGNTFKEIENSVVELVNELILRNSLDPKKILSITFSVTKDLDACFPASIARRCFGLDSVAFLDCQQMFVPNDVDFCIRLMALVIFPSGVSINHPYLRGASNLRTDRC
ncbi:chorismate mutase [Prochlorococcus sp. AH-716-E13]|nr:chorismate mutase [Prochlorococcus sp. AH-716-E13]